MQVLQGLPMHMWCVEGSAPEEPCSSGGCPSAYPYLPYRSISVVQRLCCLQLPSCGQPFSISRNSDPSCLLVAISAKHPCLSPPFEGSFSACLFLLPCPAPPCLPWNFFLVSSFALCISHLIHLTTYDFQRNIKTKENELMKAAFLQEWQPKTNVSVSLIYVLHFRCSRLRLNAPAFYKRKKIRIQGSYMLIRMLDLSIQNYKLSGQSWIFTLWESSWWFGFQMASGFSCWGFDTYGSKFPGFLVLASCLQPPTKEI